MKFKVLKDFVSSILNGVTGDTHDLELDEPTAKMWTEQGLIEEVKDVAEPDPPTQDVQSTAPVADQATATDAPTDAPAATQVVNEAPEAVTANENQ